MTDMPPTKPVELRVVGASQQVRANVQRFNRDAGVFPDRARCLMRQTQYWVWDPDVNTFGPSKFVGFSSMTFDRYEVAVAGYAVGDTFDGHVTQCSIRQALGGNYAADPVLSELLVRWGEEAIGSGVFDGIDRTKWQFVRLPQSRNYWGGLLNPTYYDIDHALKCVEYDTWTTKGSDVKRGDRLLIWRTQKNGKRGVVAIADVLSAPEIIEPSPEARRFFLDDSRMGPQDRIRIRYHVPPNAPRWLDEDQSGVLSRLAVANGRGRPIFREKPEDWHSVLHLLGGWPQEQSADAIVEAAADAIGAAEGRPSRGQGYRMDQKARKAVELHAMREADRHFREELEYEVEVVSERKPFDLLCTKGGEELHVEVKGTTSVGEEVVLTANEVEHARANPGRTVLFVFHSIQVDQENGQWVARAGMRRVLRPWDLSLGTLKPLVYAYTLPRS
ncbi:MAG: EVE domain-containing protein [Planctomycetes bacterium]|nr:EVE domain-containing protein [Planctomycetota bacterium]